MLIESIKRCPLCGEWVKCEELKEHLKEHDLGQVSYKIKAKGGAWV